jgi:O-acetyl-ADP-ribose deacetylase (regulator of RNase III)
MKALCLAIAIAFAASSFALAQGDNPAAKAAAGDGSVAHQISQKAGNAANSHNQNGHEGKGRLKYHIGRAVYSYRHNGEHCHIVHHLRGPRMKVCR